jgi:hypothetical protein
LAVAAMAVSLAAAAGRTVEVPAGVVTEGLTFDEAMQHQAELAARLVGETPADLKQVRVPITADDLAAIDAVDKSTTPLQIGIVKKLTPAILVTGTSRGAMRAADGRLVIAYEFNAERAGALRLHVENMSLPEGVEMYVYSRSGEAFGPYVGTGDGGNFWTTAVFGSQAILQIRGPEQALRAATFRVTEAGVIGSGFTGPAIDALAANFCGNPSCIVDASCYSAANSIRDAYAKMEWIAGAFIYTCTGAVLNDTNPSSTNYFLTANHCLSKAGTAKNVTFYWSFRTSACNGSCPSNNGWPYKTTGSGVAATNRKGDFSLLTLNTAPPAGTVRLGFTSAPVANTNGVALHRVSNPNFGPQVYNEQTVNTSTPTCTGWPRGERIYSRATLGGTDGGSSGSPVVNASDQVVGQLSGACGTNVNDPCDNAANATVDGALAYYWATVQPLLAP